MKEVMLQLAEEVREKPKEEISKLLDLEVEAFSKFMASLGDWKSVGPLEPGERMLIKTYLVQKLAGKLEVP